ncbi:MAG: VTT domain-containing protein [Nevskia sp.]|nr:VTT domain-containing protein [Nevskia sp.]
MDDFIRRLPEHGAALVFAAVLMEQAGLPLPSFTVLIAAGALAAGGQAALAPLLAAAVLAALAANLAWYAAGLRYGQRVLRLLCRISLSPDTCVRGTQSLFQRWGEASLLFCKFLPGISLVAPPIAGAVRMPLPRFLAASMSGTVLWALTWLVGGFLFHAQVHATFAYARGHLHAALATAAGLFCLYLAWRGVQRWLAHGGRRIARIGAAELRKLLTGDPPPLVLDLRSPLLRAAEAGIPHALEADLDSLESLARRLPRDRDIVTYCACPNDVSAVRAARTLLRLGHTRVRALRGGFDAWTQAR